MKKMKKILTILLLFLIFWTLIPSFVSDTGTTRAWDKQKRIDTYQLYTLEDPTRLVNKRYLIIGTGDISWLHIENESWHFGGKYRGIYKGDMIVGNGPGMTGIGYCLFIKDLESGGVFNKETLPGYIYLDDFVGYLRANYYSQPHGPVGFFFTIFGFADDFYEYEL